MDLAAALLGFITALLGVVLAAVTLWKKVVAGIKYVITEVLLDSGLIKRGRPAAAWPNGSDNLPDCLRTIWQTQKSIEGELRELVDKTPPPS